MSVYLSVELLRDLHADHGIDEAELPRLTACRAVGRTGVARAFKNGNRVALFATDEEEASSRIERESISSRERCSLLAVVERCHVCQKACIWVAPETG